MTDADTTKPQPAFRDMLVAEIPSMRAFAVSLCGNITTADDLVQDALLKAWGHSDSFQMGTNLRAWLFTILRNTYYSLYRKRTREVQDSDGDYADGLSVPPSQESSLELSEFRRALSQLSVEHREVLIMVGASGMSYEEVADICGVAVGTVKSRVNRGRARLAELMGISGVSDIGPDAHMLSIVAGR
ncbi:MAG: sigma-70 family RNA polymerase sigma factor [Bosea sp. (in: a-proteobacteria)]